jgi:hypothetical protein
VGKLANIRDALLQRVEYPDPIEGTSISLWPQIATFWDETFGFSTLTMSPHAQKNVWVAQRCMQLNSQQIASMPLEFFGSYEPAWVSSPDPNWYPNGISDCIFAIVDNIYRFGFSCQMVTSRYSSGFPATWTVLDSSLVNVRLEGGRREYKLMDTELDRNDVFQVDRNPGSALHGVPAITGYASQAWGIVASGELSRGLMSGGIPAYYLKSERKLTKDQAEALQAQWVARTSSRSGAPPVIPPEIEPKQMSFSPTDLLLLEGQEWNARVVATAFGVPAVLLNMSLQGGLTYQNPGALGEMWWRFELRTVAKRIADAFTAQLLPRGNWVAFDAEDTFAPLMPESTEDDPQLAEDLPDEPAVASASPSTNGNGSVSTPTMAGA